MKSLNYFLLLLKNGFAAALVAFFASMNGPALAQTGDGASTPQKVIEELIAAMEANDADRIRAVFSEDASQRYGTGSPKSGAEFRAWLESDIIAVEGRVVDPELTIDGNLVVVTGEYRNSNNYRSDADFLLEVENGRVTGWTMRY